MTKRNSSGCCELHCSECPLHLENNGTGYTCNILEILHPQRAIAIVRQWAQEHPAKTYAEDFFEKFPDAPKTSSGTPQALRCEIYEFESSTCEYDCEVCWRLPMYE